MSFGSPAPLPTQLILHSLFSVFLTKHGILTIAMVQFDLGPKIALCTRRVTRTSLHFGKSADTSVVSSRACLTSCKCFGPSDERVRCCSSICTNCTIVPGGRLQRRETVGLI